MGLYLQEYIFQNLCSHTPRVWHRPDLHQFIEIFSENMVLFTLTWKHSKSSQRTGIYECPHTYLHLQMLTIFLIVCMRLRAWEQVSSWGCSQVPHCHKAAGSCLIEECTHRPVGQQTDQWGWAHLALGSQGRRELGTLCLEPKTLQKAGEIFPGNITMLLSCLWLCLNTALLAWDWIWLQLCTYSLKFIHVVLWPWNT